MLSVKQSPMRRGRIELTGLKRKVKSMATSTVLPNQRCVSNGEVVGPQIELAHEKSKSSGSRSFNSCGDMTKAFDEDSEMMENTGSSLWAGIKKVHVTDVPREMSGNLNGQRKVS